MLAMSMHQISLQYLCLARLGGPGRADGWAGPPRSLNRHRRGRGCCIQQLRLNEFTKTKRWRNCKNGLAKVKIIVNWSVQKKEKLLKIIIRKAGREWECHYGNLQKN
jgi:hypothetical protein